MMSSFFTKYRAFLISGFIAMTFLITACSSSSGSLVDTNQAKDLAKKESRGEVTIADNNRNLGEVSMKAGLTTTVFSFTNIGDEPVVLIQAGTSCMCTTATVEKNGSTISSRIAMPGHGGGPAELLIVMQPKETLQLKAVFDPNAHGPSATGPVMREIMMTTNSRLTPRLSFTFSGNVVK